MRNSSPKTTPMGEGHAATHPQFPPARTAEEREAQLVALATDLAEYQLRTRTASSQVITHYLKEGCLRAELERDKLRLEQELTKAKTEALKSQENLAGMYADAMAAMMRYSGNRRSGADESQRDL